MKMNWEYRQSTWLARCGWGHGLEGRTLRQNLHTNHCGMHDRLPDDPDDLAATSRSPHGQRRPHTLLPAPNAFSGASGQRVVFLRLLPCPPLPLSHPHPAPLLVRASAHCAVTVASPSRIVDEAKNPLGFFRHHVALGLLDDPAYLTALGIVCASLVVAMSWFSRSGGSWGGRFSPFGRPGNSPNSGVVSDADFSYITAEDLQRNGAASVPEIVDWDDRNPERETDVLVFKERRTHYPTHFPAHSIRNGELKIGTVRQAAAKKLGIDHPGRIRLFFKGRNLKHDERTAREEGLRGDGTGSELLITVGEAVVGGLAPSAEEAPPRAWSDDDQDGGQDDGDGDDDDDDDDDGVDSGAATSSRKKSRKRGGRRSKRKGPVSVAASGTSTPGYSTPGAHAEYLPIPSHINAAPKPAAASTTPRAQTPLTPLGKLDQIASRFHTELVPLAVQFMNSPPDDQAKREFEYKKLSETILTQIIFKLDGVDTEGDPEARLKRKALVKEVQGLLTKLDDIEKTAR